MNLIDKYKNKIHVGSVLRIIEAGEGAWGCNGCVGIVTDKPLSNGVLREKEGFNIEIIDDKNNNESYCKVGQIWRVNNPGKSERKAKYEFI